MIAHLHSLHSTRHETPEIRDQTLWVPGWEERKAEVSVIQLCGLSAIPWTVVRPAPASMGFSRQEYWSGWPFPSPGDLPDPGSEPGSPALQADALLSEPFSISINISFEILVQPYLYSTV